MLISRFPQRLTPAKLPGFITLSSYTVQLIGNTTTVDILTSSGSSYTVRSSNTSVATASVSGTTITLTGLRTGNATITVTVAENETYTSATATIALNVIFIKEQAIYGIQMSRNGSGLTITRTDDAVGLPEPVAEGAGQTYNSIFDNIEPWKSIKSIYVERGSTEVKGWVYNSSLYYSLIKYPKFWYKITTDSNGTWTKLQIANYAADGFTLSPCHKDRGYGAHDYVYADKYMYNKYGDATSLAKSTHRTALKNDYSAYAHFEDYAFNWMLIMLFMVEYKSVTPWNTIGYENAKTTNPVYLYGHGNKYTNTGTTSTSRNTSGITYYRGLVSAFADCDKIFDGTFAKDNILENNKYYCKLYYIKNVTDYDAFDAYNPLDLSGVEQWISDNPNKYIYMGSMNRHDSAWSSYIGVVGGRIIYSWDVVSDGTIGNYLKGKDSEFTNTINRYHSGYSVNGSRGDSGVSKYLMGVGKSFHKSTDDKNLDLYEMSGRLCCTQFAKNHYTSSYYSGTDAVLLRGIFYSND